MAVVTVATFHQRIRKGETVETGISPTARRLTDDLDTPLAPHPGRLWRPRGDDNANCDVGHTCERCKS